MGNVISDFLRKSGADRKAPDAGEVVWDNHISDEKKKSMKRNLRQKNSVNFGKKKKNAAE
jgi:hypothetical protein